MVHERASEKIANDNLWEVTTRSSVDKDGVEKSIAEEGCYH